MEVILVMLEIAAHNTETEEASMTSNLPTLYLQNIYHPGLILFIKTLTGIENFGQSNIYFTIVLSFKNK